MRGWAAPCRPPAAGMPAAKGRYTPVAGERGRAAQQQGGKLRPQAALAARGSPATPNAPHPPHAVDVAKWDDLTRNLAELEKSCIFATESERISLGKVSLNTYLIMATMQGITGKLSGKMGAAVFRVREGQQVVTQYNPIVKNPNTEGQQAQRAKFKLMSQLAAIMLPTFGTMAVTKRKSAGQSSPRNAFTSLNFPLVEVDSAADTVTAKIPMEQLQLTSSFRALPSLTLTKEDATSINAVMDDIAPDVSVIRLSVIGYPVDGDVSQAQVINVFDVPVEDNNIDTSIPVPSSGRYTVLAFGLIPSESAKASIKLDSIHTPADEDFISAVKLNAMVADGSMAETKTVGSNIELTA